MGRTATNYDASNPYKVGSLSRDFKTNFKAGRTTVETCDWNVGYMPNAELGCMHVNDMFATHIYGNSEYDDYISYIPAINGAHSVG